MHLYLVRHGRSQGGYDAPLSDHGREQAQELGDWLAPRVRPELIFSSTMKRCAETAGLIAASFPAQVTPDHRLREVGCCFADGSPADTPPREWARREWSQQPDLPLAPGVESWNQARARVADFLGEIARKFEDESTVLAVAHAGIIMTCFNVIFDGTGSGGAGVYTTHAAVTHWEHRSDSSEAWRLVAHNLTPQPALPASTSPVPSRPAAE